MRYDAWAPRYEAIRREFGYPFEREERAAATLERLLRPADRGAPFDRVRPLLEGRVATVVGLAPGAGPPPVWRLPAAGRDPAILAADGAAAPCVAAGLVPTIVVTDLDGPVPAEVEANQRGSLVVVHAHGDNAAALERWVPEFPRAVAGSWAGPPRPALFNVGGFTDGDRAAYLAEEAGAARILLWGFDFDRVREPDPRAREIKRRKLAWSARLLEDLAAQGKAPLVRWERDGTMVRYGTSGASTR